MATTQSPPFNPNKQKIELAPNDYGKPMQRPMQLQNMRKKKRLPDDISVEGSTGELKSGNTMEVMPMPYPKPSGGPGSRPFEWGRMPPSGPWGTGVPGRDQRPDGSMKPPPQGGNDPNAPAPGTGPVFGGGPSGREGYTGGNQHFGAPVQRGPGAPSQGKPPQGAPQPGGGGGRQPLRPGMEYRPGGGQRQAGGAPQAALPNEGSQFDITGNDPGRGQRVNEMYGVDSTGWYDENGQLTDQGNQGWENYNAQNGGQPPQLGSMGSPQTPDEMNQWRRRLKGMQQQGPNNNPLYGAF